MTFNPSIPLASNSPATFPAQSQANFGRLQILLGADHQFNLTAAANDGYHTLVHMIPQAPTGALAGTGRFYSKSVSGLVQAFYMDDAGTEYQLTPQSVTETSKIVGTALFAGNQISTIFSVAYDFTGIGMVYVNGTLAQTWYNLMRTGGQTYIHNFDQNVVESPARPSLLFSGTTLQARNNSGSAQNLVWSLQINRIA